MTHNELLTGKKVPLSAAELVDWAAYYNVKKYYSEKKK